MLNLPGFHSTGSIVAEMRKAPGARNAWATLDISDCTRTVSLELDLNTPDDFENNLYKLDVMIDSLRKLRRAVATHQKNYTPIRY